MILLSSGVIVADGDTKTILTDQTLLEANRMELPVSRIMSRSWAAMSCVLGRELMVSMTLSVTVCQIPVGNRSVYLVSISRKHSPCWVMICFFVI